MKEITDIILIFVMLPEENI